MFFFRLDRNVEIIRFAYEELYEFLRLKMEDTGDDLYERVCKACVRFFWI